MSDVVLLSELTDDERKEVLARRKLKSLPNKLDFKWYVHSDSDDSREILESSLGFEIPDELFDKFWEQRPFYEVTLHCELDTTTGEVTLVKAEL